MFYYFKHLFLLRNTACLTEKNGILMHLALCTMPLYYLSEQPDVATGREHGFGFVLPGQAAQRKASRGDARQGKPSRCVGQARRERCPLVLKNTVYKQRVLMHGHQGWNVRHGLCHIYMLYVYIYIYIYIWVVYSLCFFCCLFITVTWWYVWCIEWASGNQEEVQACLVTLWLFIISCYSLKIIHIFINTQWIFMLNVSI